MHYSQSVGHRAWVEQQREAVVRRRELLKRLKARSNLAQANGEDDIWAEMYRETVTKMLDEIKK